MVAHAALCASQLQFDLVADAPSVPETTPPAEWLSAAAVVPDSSLRATLLEGTNLWPGRKTLAIAFCGCDLSCAYCFDPEHVTAHGAISSVAHVAEHVEQRLGQLDGVVLTGGEPTRAEALVPLLRALRELEMPVKLDTNGTSPDLLGALIADELVDFIALDVKATPERYDRVTGGSGVWPRVERSIAAVISGRVDHELRTTCYPFAVSAPELPLIAANLKGARRYVLQQFVSRRTLDPGAASATPIPADELRRAAVRCSVHVPTVLRGV